VVKTMHDTVLRRLSSRVPAAAAGLLIAVACALGAPAAHAERLKDLAQIQGVREIGRASCRERV